MNLINNYQKGFEDWRKYNEDTTGTKEQYICDEVFQITTYDDCLSNEIGNDIKKVMNIIFDKQNYAFINENKENYKFFIYICNLLSDNEMIDWGTSIRGCWLTSEGEKLLGFLNKQEK